MLFTGEGPVWEKDGRDWPNREASRFVEAAGLRWHVQEMGKGPALLLLHGTGAATHSWRGLAPLLARSFTVIAPDLPGHGFTSAPPLNLMSLPRMARLVGALIDTLDVRPALALGHSAGAAILVRMALDERIAPNAIVSVNGALLPFQGMAAHVFPSMAKLLFLNPLAPRIFALRARDRETVDRLIRSTGSAIDAQGVALYARLLRNPAHVAGALAMMANWDLASLERALPRLKTPLVLVVGADDRAVAPDIADQVRALLPSAQIVSLAGLGHLAHEERADEVVEIVLRVARDQAGLAEI